MKEYKTQKLLLFIAEDVDDVLRASMEEVIDGMEGLRDWAIAAPEFVEVSKSGDGNREDQLVGGSLSIYSAFEGRLPRDVDIRRIHEVEDVVSRIQALSQSKLISFEFELDGTFVGAIDDGVPDRALREGLLMSWRQHLSV